MEELERITKELEYRKRFIKQCLKAARGFAEDIVLDEDTAHPQLLVSEGGKHVECLSEERAVPESPGRFTFLRAVLGRNSFSSGSHYWEVDVGGSERWAVGLCSESVDRKTYFVNIHPGNGFWSINRTSHNYRALYLHCHNFSVVAPPSVVGIYLQYEQGLISFYDVKQLTVLHTFTGKFSGPLRPCFLTGFCTPGHYPGLFIRPVPPPQALVLPRAT
ncbi:PREDICTED: erythroid membrane-associated protein-like [Chinchilla lanigera]|uniref:erythroid membrane-associated protein-like n=1 Tax=Chinchilla lanigera TaxID=34839 RepID=UPI000697880C|nr:PREDICTED: erythroid membrane-associated protein-like [Chinchilla lanigera]